MVAKIHYKILKMIGKCTTDRGYTYPIGLPCYGTFIIWAMDMEVFNDFSEDKISSMEVELTTKDKCMISACNVVLTECVPECSFLEQSTGNQSLAKNDT